MTINKIEAIRGRLDNPGQNIEENYLLGLIAFKTQAQLPKMTFWLASWALTINSNHLGYLLEISYILKILSINCRATHELNQTSFFS